MKRGDVILVRFPHPSGLRGYPSVEACSVAVSTVSEWVRKYERPRQVVFCCFAEVDADLYQAHLQAIGKMAGQATGGIRRI